MYEGPESPDHPLPDRRLLGPGELSQAYPGITIRRAAGHGSCQGFCATTWLIRAMYSSGVTRGAAGSKRAKRWNWVTARTITKQ